MGKLRKGMKLISYGDVEEGGAYDKNSVFVFGRKFSENKFNGFYFLFNSIFEKYQEYTCSETFTKKMGWLSYVKFFMVWYKKYPNKKYPNKKYVRFFWYVTGGMFYNGK